MRQFADMKKLVALVTPAVPVNLTMKTRGGRTWILRAASPGMHPGRRQSHGNTSGTEAGRCHLATGPGRPSGPQLLDAARRTFDPDPQHRPGGRKKGGMSPSRSRRNPPRCRKGHRSCSVSMRPWPGASQGVCKQLSRFNPAADSKFNISLEFFGSRR